MAMKIIKTSPKVETKPTEFVEEKFTDEKSNEFAEMEKAIE